MPELNGNVQEIYKKIMGLQNKAGKIGGAAKQSKVVNFRISFMHKVNSIILHVNLIHNIAEQARKTVEKQHQEGKLIVAQDMMRQSIAFSHELEFKYTSIMEDIIYHTMSAIDNLPLVIVAFYKNVSDGTSFNSARKALNHEHTKDLKITKTINNNWSEWIGELHKFRGEIYHHHSKICTGHMQFNITKNKDGGHEFSEGFVIKIPKNLRDALKYPENKEIEIGEFCDDVSEKALNFFIETLNAIDLECKE